MNLPYPCSSMTYALIGVLVGCSSCSIGCGKKETPPAATPPTASVSSDVDSTTPLEVLGTVPAFQFTDQTGATFNGSSLAGKVWVANFFFTRCQVTCPRQTEVIKGLHELDSAQSDEVHFLSISVQPEFDTHQVLRQYAERYAADAARWHFLTGDREKIWELSKEGFFLPVGKAPESAEMPIFHSAKLILVDRAMRIRGFFDSQSPTEVGELRKQTIALLNESAPEVLAADTSKPAGSNAPSLSDLELLENDVAGAFSPAKASSQSTADAVQDIYAPSKSRVLAAWMAERGARQLSTVGEFKVFHGFRFRDRLPTSGIDFVNQVVEDAAKKYTAAHYDHGNGVAIADIDGDGRYDLYFTNQIGGNGLFRNLGKGKFVDVTDNAGVGLADCISVTASFADVDNDGDPDLYVTTVRHGNAMFRNDGSGHFEDVTVDIGLEYVGHSSSAVFFDYDRDGWLDLFLTNVGKYTTEEVGVGGYYVSRKDAFAGHLLPELAETCRLYRNVEGKQFHDVTHKVNLVDDSWSGAASPVDANDDGWIDLYVLDMQGHDEYFENVGGNRFEKKSRDVFPKTPWGAMGIKVFDFDNDGRFDIFITDMHSDMSERVGIDQEKLKSNMQWPESMLQTGGNSIWGNAFFHKQADGSFREVSNDLNAENYWPWGLSVGDLNADGFDDVFITSSMNLPFRYAVNSVLLNNRGEGFLDSEFILGVEPRRDGRTATPWFTLDCDGPDREHSYAKKTGVKSGKAVVWAALGSRSSVIFDYDNDGDLDIVTNDFHSEPMVLENNLVDKKKISFLKIKLVGKTSNRDGLGAVVEVSEGTNTYTKVHDGQTGYLSQSSHLLYFGLGDATKVDSVAVTWPSGIRQTISDINQLNSVLTVEEEER